MKQAQKIVVEQLRESRRARGRAPADHAPGEVLRARRPPARDRHVAPVVLPQRRPRRRSCATSCSRSAASCDWHPAAHARALRDLDRGPELRLARQPPALLRRAVPGLVSRSTPTATPIHDDPLLPTEDALPVDPSTDVPAGLHRRAARRARRVRRGPRRHGHVGHVVAHAADRDRLGRRPRSLRAHLPDGPAAAGSRDHPHVAVRHRRARALRARRAAVDRHDDQRLGARPRSQEDVEVEGQRRHADAARRGVRRRRAALLGVQRPPGASTPRSTTAS